MLPMLAKIVSFVSMIAILIAIASYIVFRYKERNHLPNPPSTLPERKAQPLPQPSLPRIQTIQQPVQAPLSVPVAIEPASTNLIPEIVTTARPNQVPPVSLRAKHINPFEIELPGEKQQSVTTPENEMSSQLSPSQSVFVSLMSDKEKSLVKSTVDENQHQQAEPYTPRRYILPGMKTDVTKSENVDSNPFDIRWK